MTAITSYPTRSLSLPTLPDLPSLLSQKIARVWKAFKESIGEIMRDAFFLPRTKVGTQETIRAFEVERLFVKNFWDPGAPLNPNLPFHEVIRKNFQSEIKTLPSIEVDGKNLAVECCSISSKETSSKPHYNFVLALGNLSKIDDSIIHIYPFITSYLEARKKDSSLPPATFTLISQYNTSLGGKPYYPKSMDEAGLILAKAIEQVEKTKGPISQVCGFSIGTLILGSALKHLGRTEKSPNHYLFDRGPSSIEELSHPLGMKGRVFYPLVKFSGWDINLGKEVDAFAKKNPSKEIVISNAKQDNYFPNTLGLAKSPLLTAQNVHRLFFDFSRQHYDPRGHHSLNNGHFYSFNQIEGDQAFFKPGENLASAIIRRSLY